MQFIFVVICTGLGLLIGAIFEHAVIGGIIGFVVGLLLAFAGGRSLDDVFDVFD